MVERFLSGQDPDETWEAASINMALARRATASAERGATVRFRPARGGPSPGRRTLAPGGLVRLRVEATGRPRSADTKAALMLRSARAWSRLPNAGRLAPGRRR
jgi:hypothetical protein